MSLFNRPAWARAQTTEEDETEDSIFSHSKSSYSRIVADEQQKKKDRLEKQRRRQDSKQRRSSTKQEIKEEDGKQRNRSPKRRRITLEEGDELLGGVGMSMKPRAATSEELLKDEDVTQRRSPRANRMANRETARMTAAAASKPLVVELGDSPPRFDDDLEISHIQPAPPAPEPEDEESDDEFAELARQARARKKLRDNSAKKSQTPDLNVPTLGQDFADPSRTAYPTPPAPDPPVKLFISSRIPDTNPLMVYRKLSQRLQEIRQVWCDKQGFSKQRADTIFLVHRMRRLFDVTTCRSLGLDVDVDGNIVMKGVIGQDGVDQVAIEAVDDAIYGQMKAEKEAEERDRQGVEDAGTDAQAGADAAPEAPEEEIIRIMLRSRDAKEPFKLRVRPSTVISKIVTACEGHFKPRNDQKLYLDFDGERLEPDATVADTEISDMDYIDVHIS